MKNLGKSHSALTQSIRNFDQFSQLSLFLFAQHNQNYTESTRNEATLILSQRGMKLPSFWVNTKWSSPHSESTWNEGPLLPLFWVHAEWSPHLIFWVNAEWSSQHSELTRSEALLSLSQRRWSSPHSEKNESPLILSQLEMKLPHSESTRNEAPPPRRCMSERSMKLPNSVACGM